MMTTSSHILGAIGETKVTLDLMELGFSVLHPVHEGGAVDLVAFKDTNLYRVQVKYRHLNGDFVEISWYGGEGYYPSLCDIIAIYVPEVEVVFYVPSSVLSGVKGNKRFHLSEDKKDKTSYLYNYIEFPFSHGLTTIPIPSCSLPPILRDVSSENQGPCSLPN